MTQRTTTTRPRIKRPGTVRRWINEIQHGDAVKLMDEMPSGIIDLTVTSPPYDGLRDYNGYRFDFPAMARELYRVTARGGVVVWVVNDETRNGSETGTSFRQALGFKEAGFKLHDTMIYAKRGVSHPETIRYYNAFEYMFVLSKGKPKTFNPIKDRVNKTAGLRRDHNERKRSKNGHVKWYYKEKMYVTQTHGVRFNIWEYPIGQMGPDPIWKGHPAVMPLRLAYDHIQSWTDPGQNVFDPMAGSGTTLIASQILGRQFIGFDVSAEYVELANRRLRWYQDHPAKVEAWLATSKTQAA